MSKVLTCWKEIATHLGKSMRTVQRWERDMGLPVRRPTLRDTGSVFAVPEELDAWVRAQPRNSGEASASTHRNEIDSLQREIKKLQVENEILRRGLENMMAREQSVPPIDGDFEAVALRQLWNRSFRALISNAQKRVEFRELVAKVDRQQTFSYSDPNRIPLRIRNKEY